MFNNFLPADTLHNDKVTVYDHRTHLKTVRTQTVIEYHHHPR